MKSKLIAFLLPLAFLNSQEIQPEDVAPLSAEEQQLSVQEYYSYMQEAIDDADWWAAIDFGELMLYHFPESPYGQEIPYFIGMAYYRLNQHELANNALSEYLKNSTSPKYFEEALQTKFDIAEFYHKGGKKRLFSSHKLPAILSAHEDALEIYDEVITTLPHHENSVRALLHKAQIQAYMEDFKPGIESLQLLIRRFPKHELAPEAYFQINKIYLDQCKIDHLDPDLLELAAANLRKLRLAFPRDPKIAEAQKAYDELQELFAENLLETGEFFQRRKQTAASSIYFSKIVKEYPSTQTASKAQQKLDQQIKKNPTPADATP